MFYAAKMAGKRVQPTGAGRVRLASYCCLPAREEGGRETGVSAAARNDEGVEGREGGGRTLLRVLARRARRRLLGRGVVVVLVRAVRIVVLVELVVRLVVDAVVLERLAGVVVDGARDDLRRGRVERGERGSAWRGSRGRRAEEGRRTHALLEVLADLVVELEALVELLELTLVDLASLELLGRGRGRRLEEVEERVGRLDDLDDARAVGSCGREVQARGGEGVVSGATPERGGQAGGRRTFVALLLDLDLARQVLVGLPRDLGALGPVVNEVAAVADLLLVIVRLLELRVLEELVGVKEEGELKTRLGLVEVGQLNVPEVNQRILVLLGDCRSGRRREGGSQRTVRARTRGQTRRGRRDALSSLMPTWCRRATSQKSGMPLSSPSVMDADSASSSSSAPALSSASVGSDAPATMSLRRW